MYLSILLMWFGGALAILNWPSGFGFVLLVPAFWARPAEEEMLIRHFGDAYAAYALACRCSFRASDTASAQGAAGAERPGVGGGASSRPRKMVATTGTRLSSTVAVPGLGRDA